MFDVGKNWQARNFKSKKAANIFFKINLKIHFKPQANRRGTLFHFIANINGHFEFKSTNENGCRSTATRHEGNWWRHLTLWRLSSFVCVRVWVIRWSHVVYDWDRKSKHQFCENVQYNVPRGLPRTVKPIQTQRYCYGTRLVPTFWTVCPNAWFKKG